MARKKELDDTQLSRLLGDYQRPTLSPGVQKTLQEASDSMDRKAPVLVKPVFGGWATKVSALAAGLLVLLGLASFLLVRSPAGVQTLALVSPDGSSTALPAVTRLESADAPLFVEATSQHLSLLPASVLDIDASPAESGQSGVQAKIRYRLSSGSMRLEHHADQANPAVPGQADFTIAFPGGMVWPLGTVVLVRVERSRTLVWCQEGALGFSPEPGKDGQPGTDLKVEPGQVLVVDLEGTSSVQGFGPAQTGPLPPDAPAAPWSSGVRDPGQIDAAKAETSSSTDSVPTTPTAREAPDGSQNPDQVKPASFSLPEAVESLPARQVWTVSAPGGARELAIRSNSLVVMTEQGIATLNLRDGRIIARRSLDAPAAAWAASDRLVIVYAHKKLEAWKLPGLEPAWSAVSGNLAFTGFTLTADRLYLPSPEGKIYIHRLGDGQLESSPDAGAGSYGRVLALQDSLTVSTLRKELVNLDAANGTRRWSAPLPFRAVDDQPLMLGDLMVETGPEGQILGLDAATGTKNWEFTLPGGIKGRPLVHQGKLLARSGDRIWQVDSLGKARVLGDSTLDLLGITRDGRLVLGGAGGLALMAGDGTVVTVSKIPVLAAAGSAEAAAAASTGMDLPGNKSKHEIWAVLSTDARILLMEFAP